MQTSWVSPLLVAKRSSAKIRFSLCCVVVALFGIRFAQTSSAQATRNDAVPQSLLLQIVKAEDERRWDSDLRTLMASKNPVVRQRAALAAGRIGNEDSV